MIFRPFESEPLVRKGTKPVVLNSTWNSTEEEEEEDAENFTLTNPKQGLNLFESNTTSSDVNNTPGRILTDLATVLTHVLNSTKSNKTDEKR